MGQAQPLSSWQVALQPSPSVRLPSSQTSELSLIPLPHCSQGTPATGQANPALDRAGRVAAIADQGIAIVADLARIAHPVAALGTRLPGGRAAESGLDQGAVVAAAVTVGAIAVVADLGRLHGAVAANDTDGRPAGVPCAGRARLELAGGTAVARDRLPSSQASPVSTLPLPHWAQPCPGTGQTQPDSIWQAALQPSPPVRLPSSHASLLSLTRLPQASQGMPATGQANPGSTVEQSALQPSPPSRLPSSQPSRASLIPLPQVEQLPPVAGQT